VLGRASDIGHLATSRTHMVADTEPEPPGEHLVHPAS